jgi:ATP-dependent DNA helicase HFM1/MER3
MFVRLQQNPQHYRIEGHSISRNVDDLMKEICNRDVDLLLESGLVAQSGCLRATLDGEAVAKYYVSFKTATKLLELPPKAKISDIVSSTLY